VVRPGLETERAPVLTLATEKVVSQLQQVKHAVNQ
jgi:hypothetical protein